MFLFTSGFNICSPKFRIPTSSPSFTNIISDTGLKSDITPVILNSTFLVKSPFSYPKIVSSALISDEVEIEDVIPEQFKN